MHPDLDNGGQPGGTYCGRMPGSARGSEVIFGEGPCAAFHRRGSLRPWRLAYSPRHRLCARPWGNKKPPRHRWRITDCSLIVRTLSAGIGTWRGTRWLPGFAGPFPPPLWM